MTNNTKRFARDQVRHFLQSDKSINLDSIDVAILYTIAGYIDLPKGECFAKREVLIFESKCSDRTFRRKTKILLENKIIFKYCKLDDKRERYLLGEKITGIIQDE